ncbi:AbrB/MazE/SpoVT family DNA-binding domain-containing protein [Candidatus Pacearchaeota archaeon]|nr:AbrB/MazE/SpoVT family DNA-binding domain-containing protein [Candidatus Pacearchaeota archaeon]MBD3283374.1 AbrB/MazE/SpoVT family DNA-binding domain-containing protein [Candidatus Pacearchaeota archaeon]
MKRKIIRQGHNTMTITLPSEWIKKLNLKPGDEIDLSEDENSLIISSDGNNKEKSATVDITNFTIPLLWRFVQSAYRAGCNEIKITFDPVHKNCEDAYHYYTSNFDYKILGEKIPPKPALVMIQSVVDRFIGLGIIETGKNYCIIRELGEPTIKEFENSLRRIFLVILQLFERVTEAIESNETTDVGLCKELHTIDLNIDRFVDYCCRILNQIKGHFSESKKILLFSTLFILELIGDEFKYIGKHLATTKKNVKDTLLFADKIEEHFKTYYKLFYKFDKSLAIELGKKDFDVYSQHFKSKEKLEGESRSIARHFMMIGKFTWALAELRIQMEF